MLPKLVRDKVPNHIAARGGQVQYQIMKEDDRKQWLLQKLLEECLEVRDAKTEYEAMERCADVLEVILEITKCALKRIGNQDDAVKTLERFRSEQEDRNGRYRDGVILQGWTEPVTVAAGKSKSSVVFPVNYFGH